MPLQKHIMFSRLPSQTLELQQINLAGIAPVQISPRHHAMVEWRRKQEEKARKVAKFRDMRRMEIEADMAAIANEEEDFCPLIHTSKTSN